MSYKLTPSKGVILLPDGALLPCTYDAGIVTALDPFSPFVKDFTAWVALGNVPAPADPVQQQDQAGVAAQNARALGALADSDPIAATVVEVLKIADLI